MPALVAHLSSTAVDLVLTVFAKAVSPKSAHNPMVLCIEVAVSTHLTMGQ